MSLKKSIHQIGELNRIIQTYQSVTEAAIATKINKRNITRCLTNPSKYKHAGNFKWKYADVESITKPSVWLFHFPDANQQLIDQIVINHKGSLKFLPKYIYLIHLVIAAKGKGKIINASNFADIVCYRNFNLILEGCINAGVIQLIQGVQVTDELNDHGEMKRISSTYGLTKEYSIKAFSKVWFDSTDGKMIVKMIARNELKSGVQPSADNIRYSSDTKIPSPTIDVKDHGELKLQSCIQPILKQISTTTGANEKFTMIAESSDTEVSNPLYIDHVEVQVKSLKKIETFKLLDILAQNTTLDWYHSKQSKVGVLKRLLYKYNDANNMVIETNVSYIESYIEEMMAVSS